MYAVDGLGRMIVVHIELTACEHSRLKDYGHRFARYLTIGIVKCVWYLVIDDVVQVLIRVDGHDTANLTDTLRVDR